jgi:hypothetical protein
MKILKGCTVVTAVALALAAFAGAGGQVTTSDVFVGGQSNEPGVNSGLVLDNGSVTVTATGMVCAHLATLCAGPAGDASFDTNQSGFGGFVLPGAPAFGLIGRVGSGPWTQVGAGPTTLFGQGELVFAVNDLRQLFDDNTGGFTVTVSSAKGSGVTRTCWPGWGHGDENHEHCGPPGLANKPGDPSRSSSDEHGKSGQNEKSKK